MILYECAVSSGDMAPYSCMYGHIEYIILRGGPMRRCAVQAHRMTASAMYEDCTSTLWLNSAHGDASGVWERNECAAVRNLISSGSLGRLGVCGALSVLGILGDAELAD
jgi:hypothetical protein